jgi:peptide/nickel transport system substrate-binding protein
MAETIAAYLQEVGLDAQPVIYEFNEYLDRLFADARPDAIFLSGGNDLVDPDRPTTSYIRHDGASASNDDDEIVEWASQAREELDPEVRGELYQRIFQKACDEAYFLYLLRSHDLYGMSESLEWEPRIDFKMLLKDMSLN